jgi:hypothetical protein
MMKNTANINIKNVFAFILVFLSWGVANSANAALPAAKVSVVYFGLGSSAEFESKVKPVFQQNASACKSCELVNFTPYKEDGIVQIHQLKKNTKTAPEYFCFIFFYTKKKPN